MKCIICGSNEKEIFKHKILGKYDIQYYRCENCGMINTEQPYWLDEAYSNAINICDTGIMKRNEELRKQIFNLICLCFDKKGKFRDYGGGYGILTRMMRDWGLDFYWSDKYADNLLAKGFDYQDNMKVELTTAAEVFEHMTAPMEDIQAMLNNTESVMFTTLPYDTYTTDKSYPDEGWWYYGFEHGQHVSFYSFETLKYIAKYFGMNYYKINSGTHLITKKNFNRIWWDYVRIVIRFNLFTNIRRIISGKSLTLIDLEKVQTIIHESGKIQ